MNPKFQVYPTNEIPPVGTSKYVIMLDWQGSSITFRANNAREIHSYTTGFEDALNTLGYDGIKVRFHTKSYEEHKSGAPFCSACLEGN